MRLARLLKALRFHTVGFAVLCSFVPPSSLRGAESTFVERFDTGPGNTRLV